MKYLSCVGIMILAIGASLGAASFVQMHNLRVPIASAPAILYTPGDGTVQLLSLPTGSSISNGQLVLPVQSSIGPLTQATTQVVAGTPNSFSCPAGSVREVSDNIPMGLNLDYTISNGAVVFNTPPLPGDTVILGCQ